MSRFLSGLRRLTGRNDGRRAFAVERAKLDRAALAPTVDARFATRMGALREAADAISVGSAVDDPNLRVRLRVTDIAGSGHALVLGASGAGKTRAVAGIAMDLFRRIAAAPGSMAVWVADHKSEFVGLLRALLADLVRELPVEQREALLGQIVVIDPFSTSALVPLQILKSEPGVAPEVQAYDVTTLIDAVGGEGMGVRQDAFLYHAILLGITRGMTLPELARILNDEVALVSAAVASPSAEARAYFTGERRIPQTSLEGVRARLHRLLRLPGTRLMLGASGSVNFRELLRDRITLVDLGSPPLGCEDIGKFWSQLLNLKFSRAIFERTQEDAARPVAAFVDEWQEGLAAGADTADRYERLLSMARSRGVSLWLISQSLAGAAKVSSTLPKVVATNTNLQMLFRGAPDDARQMAHLLPVTGRCPHGGRAPWEPRPRSPYLSRVEELQVLQEAVSSLPDRTFYFWDRRGGHRAALVRARDVAPSGRRIAPELDRRFREGTLARPIVELEREVARAAAPAFRAVPDGASAPARPTRRPRRRAE